jgi:hypothetical protein
MYFRNSSYYDGAPAVTQCGIPVGESLTYEIPVDSQVRVLLRSRLHLGIEVFPCYIYSGERTGSFHFTLPVRACRC